MTALTILLIVVAALVIIYAAAGVRIVRPYQKGLIEQLGKYRETVDPGLHLIAPFYQTLRPVDMREQVVDVPPQEVITEDNVVVSVDAVIYYEPTEPQRLVYNVSNFMLAVTKLAQTNLRNLIGDMQLDEALTSRDKINTELREILDDATDKWGVRVARVEIQRIDPPPDVMVSMHEQMKAERTRRALVTQADGEREAAITRAEGDKQSAVLRAEGDKRQQILRAEGQAEAIQRVAEADRFREQTVAEGEANAILSVYSAIHEGAPDTPLLTIKYLEALRAMADGQATKIVVPTELAGIAGSLTAVADLLGSNGTGENGEAPPPASSGGPQGAAETSG
ncbi:MAG TPA: SPFH domain-containing protein [Acidimicrobiales bacterium]|nr:SPFH domain-containing protein [Acidimicrobiales bacterium]